MVIMYMYLLVLFYLDVLMAEKQDGYFYITLTRNLSQMPQGFHQIGQTLFFYSEDTYGFRLLSWEYYIFRGRETEQPLKFKQKFTLIWQQWFTSKTESLGRGTEGIQQDGEDLNHDSYNITMKNYVFLAPRIKTLLLARQQKHCWHWKALTSKKTSSVKKNPALKKHEETKKRLLLKKHIRTKNFSVPKVKAGPVKKKLTYQRWRENIKL